MKPKTYLEKIKPYKAGVLKEGAVKLASNENPSGSSPKAAARIKEYLDKVCLYPDAGCNLLKQKLAQKFKIDEDMIIAGNGSDEILLFIAGAYLEPGRNAVTSEATFSEYTFATALFGGEIRYAKMEDHRFNLDNILGLIDRDTHVIFIANPNNPTGTYVTHRELEDFIKKISPDTLVMLDEAYSEYVTEKDYPDSLSLMRKYGNILFLRTFSKIYGLAGLRIGYGIGSPAVIADLHKTKEPFNVNSLAQAGAAAALDDVEFVQHSVEINEKGKQYLYGEFDAMRLWYVKTAANFIFLRIGMECGEAFRILMDQGVTIRPMPVLGYTDSIRVTIGTEDQNKLFISLLKKLLKK